MSRATLARMAGIEELLRTTPIFSRLSPEDRRKIAEVATVKHFSRGDAIFEQDTPSDALYAIASGRVKIFKMMPNGKDVILEVFGPGDPLGAVAVYIGRPFLYGLGAMGEQGVTRCLEIIRNELDLTMAFCGRTQIGQVDRSILLPPHGSATPAVRAAMRAIG